jgi:hypothetical protein
MERILLFLLYFIFHLILLMRVKERYLRHILTVEMRQTDTKSESERLQAKDMDVDWRIIQCVRKVAVHLDLWGTAKSTVYHGRPLTLN